MQNHLLLASAALALAFNCITLPANGGPAASNRVELLSREISKSPSDQTLYLRRALAWSDSGRSDNAAADVQRAEALGDPVDAALIRGILLYRQARLPEAQSALDLYLAAHPAHTGALEYRARVLRDMNKHEAALADYESLFQHAQVLNPGYYLSAAEIMVALPQRGVKDALALLDVQMQRTGPIPQLQRYAIALEVNSGNFNGAMARLATLDEKIKATPKWHVDMAELYLLSDDPAAAEPHLQIAIEQLATGRLTPARQRLSTRASEMMRKLRATAP